MKHTAKGAATSPMIGRPMERLLIAGLAVHALACQVALLGLGGWFQAHPALLETGLQVFAATQILGTFLVLAFVLSRRGDRKWIGALAAIYAVGLAVELVGVETGRPFGAYAFTGLLGSKILGRVPALIPLSWFNVAVPAWGVACVLFPRRAAARIAGGAFLMLSWDLVVDPIMGHLYPFWTWRDGGAYYGVPASNFVAWFLVATAMTAILERLPPLERSRERRPLVAVYGVSFFGPIGIALTSRLWLAALLAVPALAGAAIGWRRVLSPSTRIVE